MRLNRRQLLNSAAALAAVSSAGQGLQDCAPCFSQHPAVAPAPLRKLRVKPVLTSMIHTASWEGTCRWNNVTVAQETESVKSAYARWTKELKISFRSGPAAQVVFDEAFTLPAAGMLPGRTVDVAAYARSLGDEVLLAADQGELERTMWLLRARAAYRETRIKRGLASSCG